VAVRDCRHIYAKHCAAAANGRQAAFRFAAQLTLDDDETEQLAAKIDDQRVGRRLLARCARLPETTVPRSSSSTSPGSRSQRLQPCCSCRPVRSVSGYFGREPDYAEEQTSHDRL